MSDLVGNAEDRFSCIAAQIDNPVSKQRNFSGHSAVHPNCIAGHVHETSQFAI